MENPQTDNIEQGGVKKPREPVFNLPGILVVFVILCVGMHILRTAVFSDAVAQWIFFTFAYFPIRFTPEFFMLDLPTVVSPVGHTLLHGDWAHLGMNMVWLVAFGAPVAYRLGTLKSIFFWVLTAIGAVLLHTMIYFGDTVPLIGAS